MTTSNLQTVRAWLVFCAAAIACAGCGAPDAPVLDAGTPSDTAPGIDGSDAAARDAGLDAAGGCGSATDCDDGVFCNGAERCAPADPTADPRGCAAPSSPACMPTQTCDEATEACLSDCDIEPDADGDGADSMACGGTDCDDANPRRAPGRAEICDAADEDEDCDPSTFGFRDLDGDAYPDASCCNTDGSGASSCGTDCVDTRPDIHPSLAEACDGADNDCDASIDEGVLRTFYVDADGDSFGDELLPTTMACTPPPGSTEMGRDCDDTRADVSPVSPEICDVAAADENCNGEANPPILCMCTGDVSRACALPGRCAAGTQRCVGGSWGACSITAIAEICNGEDDDCDGRSDETTTVRCYRDLDGDEAPIGSAVEEDVCPAPGRGAVGGCPIGLTDVAPVLGTIDCDDDESTAYPGATETCDGARIDEDCDGMANPDPPCACSGVETRGCVLPGRCSAGSETCGSGAWGACSISAVTETCNGVDDDCDGAIDDGVTIVCYPDADDDGFSPGGMSSMECAVGGRGAVGGCPYGLTNRAPASAATTDCNDAMRPDVSPLGVEVCDAARVDENCDGMANPDPPCACSGLETQACSLPGRCGAGIETCNMGSWGACSISPEPESCNTVDDDCDGRIDEGATVRCYADDDNDTYSPAGSAAQDVCEVIGRTAVGGCPVGLTNRAPAAMASTDCNDTSPGGSGIFPGAPESCVGAVDDDCDGTTNEGCACTVGDPSRPCQLLGVCAGGTETCGGSPAAWVCDRSPGAESCNDADDDCDGSTDEGTTIECWTDGDSDTYAAAGAGSIFDCTCPAGTTSRDPALAGQADCDDGESLRSPAVSETCNLVDDDCDGAVDDGLVITTVYVDTDGDTRRGTATMRCRLASDTISSEDCDELRVDTYGGAPELCDRRDNDCSSGGGADASEDVDLDGHASTANACSGGDLPKDDCNDNAASIFLDAPELCDRVDTDCRSGGGAVTAEDLDNDMHAPLAGAGCSGGFPTDDCNDMASDVNPAAPELCDRRDNDCSSGGGTDASEDGDLDAHAPTMAVCMGGYLRDDCNDMAATTFTGAPELCNRVDDNCSSGGGTVTAEDADGDGHAPTAATCAGGPFPRDDCNDAVSSTYTGATEICNRVDDNCGLPGAMAGGVDAAEDFDGDGHAATSAACTPGLQRDDCNDAVASIYTGATETCNGADDDCDMMIDDNAGPNWYRDSDGDGYGSSPVLRQCTMPAGYVADGSDCEDTNPIAFPGGIERCSAVAEDCVPPPTNTCPSSSETYTAPVYGPSPYIGSTGGTVFGPDLCSSLTPPMNTLVGFDVWYGLNPLSNPGIRGIAPVCVQTSIREDTGSTYYSYVLENTGSRTGVTRGNEVGTMAALRCPPGYEMYGIGGTSDSSGGIYSLGLLCRQVTWGGTVAAPPFSPRDTTMTVPAVGFTGAGTSFNYACPWSSPSYAVGVAIRGRTQASGDLGALAFGCSNVGYVPQ